MGRPMRPIDPADGITQAFAAELRQLREHAGSPPFRQMARRAHYSATTLSVACAGASLPSLEVTLAFVRACDGPVDYWLQRWHDASAEQPGAAARPADGAGADDRDRVAEPTMLTAAGRLRRPVAFAAVLVLAAAAGAAVWSLARPAAGGQPGTARQLYVGVSPCDVGAVILSQAEIRLPAPVRLAAHDYPAGTVVGVVALRYSRKCALAWTRFLPAAPFSRAHAGTLVLESRRAADGATSTVTLSPVVAAEGDPVLTVPGCVLAQATLRFGPGQPAATAATGCYP